MPLDMTRTQVRDDTKRIVRDRAIGYAPQPAGWRHEASGWEQTGDGSVMTTVLDLAKWDANFYAPKVGGRALVDALVTRGKLLDGKELDYAAGLGHGSYRGQPTVWHSGGWAGYRSQLERFPALETTIAVLCNALNADPAALAHRVADVVLEAQLQPEPIPTSAPAKPIALAPAELDRWVAKYAQVETGEVLAVERDAEALALVVIDERYLLVPTSPRTFVVTGTPAVVTFEGEAPHRLMIARDESFEQRFAEVEVREPSARELAALVGRYRSDEIGTEWRFSLVDGKLVATGRAFDGAAAITPGVEDAFSITAIGAPFRVTRDSRRRVTGFTLSLAGVRGVRFERVK